MSVTLWGADKLGSFDCVERGVGRALMEFGELVRALGLSTVGRNVEGAGRSIVRQEYRPEPIVDVDSIAEEMADVVIVLYRAASAAGIDLHTEIDRKMAINRKRDWRREAGGTGRHIDGGGRLAPPDA